MQGDYPCFKTTYTNEELVEHFLRSIGRDIHHRAAPTDAGGIVYRVEFSDVLLWQWFFAAGLTPTDLTGIDGACPHLDRLFAGNETWWPPTRTTPPTPILATTTTTMDWGERKRWTWIERWRKPGSIAARFM